MESPSPPEAAATQKGFSPKERVENFLDRWPRMVSLVKCQSSFLLLMSVSFLMGYIISRMESPSEIQANDAYMRKFYMTRKLPLESTLNNLVALPTACLVGYGIKVQEEVQDSISTAADGLNNSIGSYIDRANTDLVYLRNEAVMLNDTNTTLEEFTNFANLTFQSQSGDVSVISNSVTTTSDAIDHYSDFLSNKNKNNSNTSNHSLSEQILEYAQTCSGIAEELVLSLLDFALEVNSLKKESEQRVGGSSDGLSFNWIRCWNESSYGPGEFIYKGTTADQRNATLLTSQVAHFDATWNQNRMQLYESLVAEQGCDEISEDDTNNNTGIISSKAQCHWEATKKSVSEATGKKGCVANTASASFFWFTVMKRNTTPQTFASRTMVYCFGWLMIVAFGLIMVVNAYTFTTFLDDIFRRVNLRWLQHPLYAAPLWACVSVAYIAILSYSIRSYWDIYAPSDYTMGDSYWFSYITVLTVGFGDFFIQPQGLFFWDFLGWAFLLLQGFTIISSFLEKFSNLAQLYFPKPKESLEYHLARTDICGSGINTPVSKSLDVLRELAKERGCDDESGTNSLEVNYRRSFNGRDDCARTPDGSTINRHRITILTEKKTILIRLLLDNQSELEDRMASSAFEQLNFTTKEAEATDSKRGEGINNDDLIKATTTDFSNGRGGINVTRPTLTVEALNRDEEDLQSILFRTRELRKHVANPNIGDDRPDGP